MTPDAITSLDALHAEYGEVNRVSLAKEVERLTPAYRAFIAASPFALIGTVGPDGLDCSPRGDGPGFVSVEDDATLIMADRRGNNRLDTLRNIVADPRVTLLFMIPGVGETLRVNGRAIVTADAALKARFVMAGKEPATLLVITIERVYFQCARALARSKLWDPTTWAARGEVPSAGRMIAEIEQGFEAKAYDDALPARQAATLY